MRTNAGGGRPQRSAEAHDPDPVASGFQQTMQNIGLVAAPLTLITALLFYIGWARTDRVFAHFGIDLAFVGLTNQDYMLRSVEGLYVPLGALLILTLLGMWVHALARRALVISGKRRAVKSLGWILLTLGSAAFLAGVLDVTRLAPLPVYTLYVPLLLGAGVVAASYGRWLLSCVPGMRMPHPKLPQRNIVELTLISLLLVLSLFWAAFEFAAAVGRGRADAFARGISGRPGVVLYSAERLFLSAPGVHEEMLPGQPPAAYRYRYSGLRLLGESNDRLFLLPEVWSPGTTTFMFDFAEPGIRVEFTPGIGS